MTNQRHSRESGNPLPEGWLSTPLDDVLLSIVGGGTPSKSNASYFQGDIPWMSVKDMNKHTLEDTVDHITQEAVDNSSTNIIPAGTPIVATRMSLGKIVVASFDSAINQDLKALFHADGIERDYLVNWYRSQSKKIEILGTGTTVKGIRLEVLKALNFPLPPLAEQKVIADQLDTLLAQVETTKARLERLPEILKTFRQSVLAAAVSGKLTNSHSNFRNELLTNCFECIDGDRGPNYPKKNEYLSNGYCLFLSTKNVRKFGFDFGDTVFISKEKDNVLRKGRLERGDIVVTTRGTLGYVASYDETVPYDIVRINSGMLILRKKDEEFINDYFKILIASPYFQKLIEDQRTGSAQPQLPAKILKDFILPVPEYGDQAEIVRRVEELFAFADTIEQQTKAALERVNHLTQSILAKAFRGELTADWRAAHPELISGDNSAEALLAKIKAQRDAMAPKKRTKKPRVG